MAAVSVISWNVRGLNSAVKRSLVFKFLQIVFLQERQLVGSRILGLKGAWVGSHYHALHSGYSRGEASILVHKSLPFQLLDIKTDTEGRYIVLHALIESIPLVLVGLYLLPPADGSLLGDIMRTVLTYGVGDVLFLGDFNMTPTPDLDRLSFTSRWTPDLAQWMGPFALVDVWRHFHPAIREFTCHSVSCRTFSRIDLILATRTLLNRFRGLHPFQGGHALVRVVLRIGENDCGGCPYTG